MSAKGPDWWTAILLALAAYRLWRLLAEDEITERPRRWALRLGSEWKKEGDPVPSEYRLGWGQWLRCPWCAGAWIALAWWLAWFVLGDWATMFAVPLALSATVGIVRVKLDPAEE